MSHKSTIQLQNDRLAIAAILAETRRAYDAAVSDAERHGSNPATDITVQLLTRNLQTAEAQHEAAAREHHAALRTA
jgi:hypothetical protein